VDPAPTHATLTRLSALDLFTNAKECGQGRVVQKYIERPLLSLATNSTGPTRGVKFDMRFWVLVTSFAPLRAFVYNRCYGRQCSHPFDLHDIGNEYSHISNYAVQKVNHGARGTRGPPRRLFPDLR
jgi:tubulin polyglutamylase TTLL5